MNIFKTLRPIQIAAGISFVLGKLTFIPAAGLIFTPYRGLALGVIILYVSLITLSVVLCFIDVYQQRKKNNQTYNIPDNWNKMSFDEQVKFIKRKYSINGR